MPTINWRTAAGTAVSAPPPLALCQVLQVTHLESTSKKLLLLPKTTFSFYFDNFVLRLGQLEKHPDYFHLSSLQYAPVESSGHPDIRHSLFKLTKAELDLFPPLASIASILDRPPNSHC